MLGAGNGGHAVAGDLASRGHEVVLAELPQFAGQVAGAQTQGGVWLKYHDQGGEREVFARLADVTTDVSRAVERAAVVFVVVPAYGQGCFLDLMLDVASPDQLWVFMPGKFVCVELRHRLRSLGVDRGRYFVAETISIPYACRLQGVGRVAVKGVKQWLGAAALDPDRTEEAIRLLNLMYPQIGAMSSVLETSLYNPGIIIHPVSTLLNASRLEEFGPYRQNAYGCTPAVGKVMDALDAEIAELGATLGLCRRRMPETLRAFYGSDAGDCYAALHTTPAYRAQMSADALSHRYVTEDVPFGLVPVLALASAIGCRPPTVEAVVRLAMAAVGMDFVAVGRNGDKLGLVSKADIDQLMSEVVGQGGEARNGSADRNHDLDAV